ncbi:MAG: helix-turn-helix transcriptional regulator [Pseudonocardiaceae bacterium]
MSFARCSCFLAMTALRAGDLPAAEAHARASLDATGGQRWFLRRMVTATLVETLVERGALDEAQAALVAVDGDGELGDFMMINFLLFARARLRVARGEPESGLADLFEYGRRPGSPMRDNPAVRPWRSEAALVELGFGRADEARRLAVAELELARALHSDRATGVALRALGLAEGGPHGEHLLSEAVAVLGRSPARLDQAHALVDLGAAIRRRGRRTDARGPLAEGLDLAHRCGARALAERALVELRAAGARPRRLRRSGVEGLTASERRVAEMAAAGLANREIAQALFVTLRTIEVHLTHAYAKLGISSRSELPAALAGSRGGLSQASGTDTSR